MSELFILKYFRLTGMDIRGLLIRSLSRLSDPEDPRLEINIIDIITSFLFTYNEYAMYMIQYLNHINLSFNANITCRIEMNYDHISQNISFNITIYGVPKSQLFAIQLYHKYESSLNSAFQILQNKSLYLGEDVNRSHQMFRVMFQCDIITFIKAVASQSIFALKICMSSGIPSDISWFELYRMPQATLWQRKLRIFCMRASNNSQIYTKALFWFTNNWLKYDKMDQLKWIGAKPFCEMVKRFNYYLGRTVEHGIFEAFKKIEDSKRINRGYTHFSSIILQLIASG